MFGLPGSGKTYVARHLSETYNMAHVSADKLRFELFDKPRHDKAEIQLLNGLMNYMTEEFLKAGVSVVYDVSVSRETDRRILREIAKKQKVKDLMLWPQVDAETAKYRSLNRDKRKTDDKYSEPIDAVTFEKYKGYMQSPYNENYLVLSGKHLFNTHKGVIEKRLLDLGVLKQQDAQHVAKPQMVNLVSQAQAQAGRVDHNRRNLTIR